MKGHPILLSAACWLLFILNVPATVFYVNVNSTNPTPPYATWSTASTDIQSAVDIASSGDRVLVTNGNYQIGSRQTSDGVTNRAVVTNAVTVQSVNGQNVTSINGGSIMRCIYLANGAALTGFTLYNGNAGINASPWGSGGGAWCDSTNSYLINCILANNSANNGGGVSSGTLNSCTLTNNTCGNTGGGAFASTLNYCVVINNSSSDYGGGAAGNFPSTVCLLNNCSLLGNVSAFGGGVFYGNLTNCTVSGNSASWGGGALDSTLNNCLVSGNSAHNLSSNNGAESIGGGVMQCSAYDCTIAFNSAVKPPNSGDFIGGGAADSTLYNCIVQFNSESPYLTAANQYNYNYYSSSLTNCCTSPSAGGIGNFTSDPLFINQGSSNYHLSSNSPCINSGNNTYVTTTNDLDGNPRIQGGTVDIGCYEYQTPSSIISYAWLQSYGLPTDGTADHADSDGDGMNNFAEWKAGTNPTNAASVLALQSPTTTNTTGITVTWQSVSGVTYYLQSSTNLQAFTALQSNLVGQAGATSYTDTTATNSGPYYYRVGVQ